MRHHEGLPQLERDREVVRKELEPLADAHQIGGALARRFAMHGDPLQSSVEGNATVVSAGEARCVAPPAQKLVEAPPSVAGRETLR